MTPRPPARTRRAAALIVIAAVGLLATAGCDPRTLLYFLQPFEPTIPPPGPSLKGKRVVVIAHAVTGTQGDFQAIDRELARALVTSLRKNVKRIDVVNPDKVWEWIEGHPSWSDPSEAARAFEADMAIFLEVESFQVASPSSPGLLEGVAKTHIQVFEMAHPKNSKGKVLYDQPKEGEKIYDDYQDTNFPVRGPIPETSANSRAHFKNRFLQVVAAQISWHFVEHTPDDEIKDGKPLDSQFE